jgi:uncharacterized membrane protein
MTTEDTTLWVRSEVLPDGTYGVGLNVGPDRAWALNRDQAIAHAVGCFARATEAEHDAAVFALLQQIGLDERLAVATLVNDLRPNRPDDHSSTAPLQFTVGLRRVGPFLYMALDGRAIGELTPHELRGHAIGVLTALAAADLDANLRRALVGQYGLDDARARDVVASLEKHWPTDPAQRGASSRATPDRKAPQ